MYALLAPDTPRVVNNSLVVAIDGVCREDGEPGVKGAYGVYFAPASALNSNGLLPLLDGGGGSDSGVPTSQKAELYALSKALDAVEQKFVSIMVSRLVIITDSMYLIDGLTKHVWEWEYNGYVDEKGIPVVNGKTFKELHRRIGKLERDGKDVCFWAVEREWNAGADELANAALEGQ